MKRKNLDVNFDMSHKKKSNPFSLRKRFEQLIGNKRIRGQIQFSSDSSSNEQMKSSQIFVYSVRGIHQNDSISKGMLVEKTVVAWALRQITCGLNFRLSMKLLSFDILHSIFMRQFDPLCRHQPTFPTRLSSLKSYEYFVNIYMYIFSSFLDF